MLHYSPVPKEHLNRKPRKVFKKGKEPYFKNPFKSIQNNPERVSGASPKENEAAKKILNIILTCAAIVLGSLIFISIYYWDKNKNAKHSSDKVKIEKLKEALLTEQMNEAYQVLVKSGKIHMNYGDRDYANAEFQRALKIDPYGKEAAIGLTEILVDNCINSNNDCKLARQWVSFCKKSFIQADEIYDLEKRLVQKSTAIIIGE